MDKCKACSKEFEFKDFLKKFSFGYKKVICKNCGSIHSHQFVNRLLGAGLAIVPLILSEPITRLILGNKISVLLYIIIFLILVAVLLFPTIKMLRFKLVEKTLDYLAQKRNVEGIINRLDSGQEKLLSQDELNSQIDKLFEKYNH